eukprot:7967958-Pyramimonas_sp.AAC.1
MNNTMWHAMLVNYVVPEKMRRTIVSCIVPVVVVRTTDVYVLTADHLCLMAAGATPNATPTASYLDPNSAPKPPPPPPSRP